MHTRTVVLADDVRSIITLNAVTAKARSNANLDVVTLPGEVDSPDGAPAARNRLYIVRRAAHRSRHGQCDSTSSPPPRPHDPVEMAYRDSRPTPRKVGASCGFTKVLKPSL